MYSRMFGSSQMVFKEYMFALQCGRETAAIGIRPLHIYDPEYWRKPFQQFMFKFGVIFFGIWLLLGAIVPIGPFFSPLHLFGATIWVGEAPPAVSTSTILYQSL